MITKVELTELESNFLKQFAEKHYPGAEDNLSTRDPIFVVERKCELPAPQYYGDGKEKYIAWHNCERFEADKPEELVKQILQIEPLPFETATEEMTVVINGEEHFILDEDDYFKAYLEPYGIKIVEKFGTHITWTPVAFFFTLAEARRYRDEYQSHNCTNCRIYGYGLGYSNKGDLPTFRSLMLRMGQALLEQSKED